MKSLTLLWLFSGQLFCSRYWLQLFCTNLWAPFRETESGSSLFPQTFWYFLNLLSKIAHLVNLSMKRGVCRFYISAAASPQWLAVTIVTGWWAAPACLLCNPTLWKEEKKRSCVFSFNGFGGSMVLDGFQPCKKDQNSSGLRLSHHWQHKIISQRDWH